MASPAERALVADHGAAFLRAAGALLDPQENVHVLPEDAHPEIVALVRSERNSCPRRRALARGVASARGVSRLWRRARRRRDPSVAHYILLRRRSRGTVETFVERELSGDVRKSRNYARTLARRHQGAVWKIHAAGRGAGKVLLNFEGPSRVVRRARPRPRHVVSAARHLSRGRRGGDRRRFRRMARRRLVWRFRQRDHDG
mmetsp:Transcript_8066/g.23971  ORF Transcript_8066/g.23971 Transcript_8066/m.23971 type:complete len:201 (-) Transcript_8066:213-815(-)